MNWLILLPGVTTIWLLLVLLVTLLCVRKIRAEYDALQEHKKPCAHCVHSIMRRYQ